MNGIEVDVIETRAVTDEDLDGLDDGDRLFLAGHRWALDTAGPVRLTTVGRNSPIFEVPVATPAGLVAAKSHAAGYPRAARRATRHGGDLYDLFRLVEVFDAQATLRAELEAAPGGLGQLVAHVVEAEFLANPARAMRQMSEVASAALDLDRIIDVMEPFAAELSG